MKATIVSINPPGTNKKKYSGCVVKVQVDGKTTMKSLANTVCLKARNLSFDKSASAMLADASDADILAAILDVPIIIFPSEFGQEDVFIKLEK